MKRIFYHPTTRTRNQRIISPKNSERIASTITPSPSPVSMPLIYQTVQRLHRRNLHPPAFILPHGRHFFFLLSVSNYLFSFLSPRFLCLVVFPSPATTSSTCMHFFLFVSHPASLRSYKFSR